MNDLLAGKVLATAWNRRSKLSRVQIGVNRAVWRADDFWLSCAPVTTIEAISREHRLLETLRDSNPPVSLPLPIPVTVGETLFVQGDSVWWATINVPGVAPKPSVPREMDVVVAGIAKLHAWLYQFNSTVAVSNYDTRAWVHMARNIASDTRLQLSVADQLLVLDSAAFVDSLLDQRTLKRQLIHGDPSHPNLRISESLHNKELTGVLDWESARFDSIFADLAVLAQTVVFRSETRDVQTELERMCAVYGESSGETVIIQDVLTYLVAAKLESLAHHGLRYIAGIGPESLARKQPQNIAVAMGLLRMYSV